MSWPDRLRSLPDRLVVPLEVRTRQELRYEALLLVGVPAVIGLVRTGGASAPRPAPLVVASLALLVVVSVLRVLLAAARLLRWWRTGRLVRGA